MKQTLDFLGYTTTDVVLDAIRDEFDVRPTTVTSLKATNEMQILGLATRRPPYVTTDLVIVDGRHLTDGWRNEKPRPTTIRVRMLPFSWDALTHMQKAQVEAWALEQNMPTGKEGYREFAVTEDIKERIKAYLKDGIGGTNPKSTIRELLRYVPAIQFDIAYRAAEESVKQSLADAGQKRMVKDDLTPKQAAETLPKWVRPAFMQKVNGGANPRPDKPTVHFGAKNIRDKQRAIDSALTAVGGYTNTLFTHLGVPGYSVSITQSILKYHRETIERLSKRFEKGAAVVEKAILAEQARLTRNPNRS
jgi:hypothetical protein